VTGDLPVSGPEILCRRCACVYRQVVKAPVWIVLSPHAPGASAQLPGPYRIKGATVMVRSSCPVCGPVAVLNVRTPTGLPVVLPLVGITLSMEIVRVLPAILSHTQSAAEA